jgi:hypothetical protein
MQGKTLSLSTVKVEEMSKATNISIDEIRKSFEGKPDTNGQTNSRKTNSLFNMPFIQGKSTADIQKEKEIADKKREAELQQALTEIDTACDLYEYMKSNLGEIERIPFYEKLILLIAQELPNTNDFDELTELWKHSPAGSSEEKLIREKINAVLTTYLAGETDIDNLTEKFEELPEAFNDVEGKQILKRAIELCSDTDECGTVEEHLEKNGSTEDRLLDFRRAQIEVEEIKNTTDIDELKELYENANSASENERRLAEKLVDQYTDLEDLKEDLVDFFPDGTYGHFLTIKKMLTLVTTLEEANEVIEQCSDATEELYLANNVFNEIFQQELAKADVDRLDEILEFLDNSLPEFEQVLEKKASLIDDIDELQEFAESCSEGSVEHGVALEKISAHYKELVEKSSDFETTLELIADTIPDDDPSYDQALLKLHTQAISEEEYEIVNARALSSSYVEYLSSKALLALRGSTQKQKVSVVIPTLEPQIDQKAEEERVRLEKEYTEKCSKARRDITRAYTPEQARAAYDICPLGGSEEQALALNKIDELVQEILRKNATPYTLGQLYSVTVPDTETRFAVIKKMAEAYKKNFFGF